MIVLFTDFGIDDPYVGQMRAVIQRRLPEMPVIDLLHNVPSYDIRAGAYLLDALQREFREGDVFAGVVDPGVGSDRAPVIARADGKWYVGPDNGLFGIVCRRAKAVEIFRVDWRPQALSASFHGRDLFAPTAAALAAGAMPECSPHTPVNIDAWPDELDQVIYVDHFGNAVTGRRAASVSQRAIVQVGDRRLETRRTFSSAKSGEPFWYPNSVGLVEIAAREASAAELLDLSLGDGIRVIDYEALLDDAP